MAIHNPPRLWLELLAKDPPRKPQTEAEKLRYYGFCAPDGTVRAQDKEAFENANPSAFWRRS